MVECPTCGVNLSLGEKVEKGELTTCSDCGTELEVSSTDPIVVIEAPQAEEDWGQ